MRKSFLKMLMTLSVSLLAGTGHANKPDCGALTQSASLTVAEEFAKLEPAKDDGFGLGGWVEFEFRAAAPVSELQVIRRFGRQVAVLVHDGRYRGGLRLVKGYVYDFSVSSQKTVPLAEYIESLTTERERESFRGRRLSSDAKAILTDHEIIITPTPPTYTEDMSSGNLKRLSNGWARKPNENSLIYLNSQNIVLAKYLLDNF